MLKVCSVRESQIGGGVEDVRFLIQKAVDLDQMVLVFIILKRETKRGKHKKKTQPSKTKTRLYHLLESWLTDCESIFVKFDHPEVLVLGKLSTKRDTLLVSDDCPEIKLHQDQIEQFMVAKDLNAGTCTGCKMIKTIVMYSKTKVLVCMATDSEKKFEVEDTSFNTSFVVARYIEGELIKKDMDEKLKMFTEQLESAKAGDPSILTIMSTGEMVSRNIRKKTMHSLMPANWFTFVNDRKEKQRTRGKKYLVDKKLPTTGVSSGQLLMNMEVEVLSLVEQGYTRKGVVMNYFAVGVRIESKGISPIDHPSMAQLEWLTQHVDEVRLLWPGEARSEGRHDNLFTNYMGGIFVEECGKNLGTFTPMAKVNNANMYADAKYSFSSSLPPIPEDVVAPSQAEIYKLNMCARDAKLKLKEIKRAAYQSRHNPEQDIVMDNSDTDNLDLCSTSCGEDDTAETCAEDDTAEMPAGFTMQIDDANLELEEYSKDVCAGTKHHVGRRRKHRKSMVDDSSSGAASGAPELQAMLWSGVLRRSDVRVLEKYEGRVV